MLRYLARTPGVTRHDENSLLLSFSPSTGNISVVKEIVDKLLKGYDVRLRPDFGGTVRAGQGRAGAGLGQGWGCSVSVLAPGLPTHHRECSPHTSPPPHPYALLPHISFLLSLFLSFHHLCRHWIAMVWCF